jgi:hypothetical protein
VSPRVPDIRPLGLLPVHVSRRGRRTSAIGSSFNPTAWSPAYPFEPVSHRQAGPTCRDSFFSLSARPGHAAVPACSVPLGPASFSLPSFFLGDCFNFCSKTASFKFE